jgi:hypothetical protein
MTAALIAVAAAVTTAWASYGIDPHPVAVVGCFAVLCAAFAAAVHAIRNA